MAVEISNAVPSEKKGSGIEIGKGTATTNAGLDSNPIRAGKTFPNAKKGISFPPEFHGPNLPHGKEPLRLENL